MEKRSNIIISALMLLLFVAPLVSANSFDFENAKYQITRVIDSALGMLSPILEKVMGDYTSSEFFFHKILLLVLLIIITKNILDRTPIGENNKKVSLIVSLIVSILSIRFINENNFFEAIFIQYGVLGIAITTILPMVIFFYFIHNTRVGTYGRKVFWTLYTVTMTGIWIVKSSEIPEVANWIYGITLLASIVFIFFDSLIHSYFGLSDFLKYEKRVNKKMIRKIMRDLDELEEDHKAGRVSDSDYKKEKADFRKQIAELSKE